jgi:hypothetical protein
LRDPPLGHRTLRSRLPAEAVPEVPSLFLSSEKGKKNEKSFFLEKNSPFEKKVVATSFLNFKNYYYKVQKDLNIII